MTVRTYGYVSTATRPFTGDGLHGLLRTCREQNGHDSVTGLLLYCDGNFMQVLEGPPARLDRALERIRASSKHGGLIELFDEHIAGREFAQWSMAFCVAPRAHMQGFIQARSGVRQQMLAEFWRTQVR